MALPPVISYALALLVFSYLLEKTIKTIHDKKFAHQHGCLPAPEEKSRDPIFRVDRLRELLAAAREHRFLPYSRSRYLQYGFTFQSYIFRRKMINTAEPANLQAILARDSKNYSIGSLRRKAFRPLLGHGIFASDGAQWEKSRILLRPSFTRERISDIDVYEKHACQLIECIPKDGSAFDLQELFYCMTIDSATEFLFGESVNTLVKTRPASATQFAKDYHDAQAGLIERVRLGALFHLFWNRKQQFNGAVARSRTYISHYVQQAIQSQKPESKSEKLPDCFLTQLATVTTDETELTDQLLNILLAGRDTTASLLSVMFHFLARHPDVWKKLQADVKTLGEEKPSFQQLRGLKYVSWVINETLRIYPIIPRNIRTAVRDTVLPRGGGPDGNSPVFIAEGQNVLLDMYTLHRRHDIYGPDVDEFKPERWENIRPGWGYVPFGGGPRMCIGQQFALTEASYTMVKLAQHFDKIESRDQRPLQELLTISSSSLHGTRVAMFPAA